MEIGLFEVLVVLASIAVAATLHEFMHGYVAYKLGDNTAKFSGRLTLNPIAHVDPFLTVLLPILSVSLGGPLFGAAKPVPFNPSNFRNGETGLAMVALAGPLTNFVLAALGGGIYQFLGMLSAPGIISEVLLIFIAFNLGFFIFNMIPFPPLDGSRLLYVLAPEPVRRVMQTIESTGLLGIAIFVFVGFRYIGPLLGEAIDILLGLLTGVSVLT